MLTYLNPQPMRILLLFAFLTLVSVVRAQDVSADSLDRKGRIWLAGSIDSDARADQMRAGYYFSDRFLVGTGLSAIGNGGVYLSPFVRYYLNDAAHQWRPYGEAGLELEVGSFGIERKYGALGLERTFNATTLLNLELRYTHYDASSRDYRLRGNLNTLLGGTAWKSAAETHFEPGSFVLGNQLFQGGINTASGFSFSYVNLSPAIDYFLTDRFALQGSLDLSVTAFDQSEAVANLDYRTLSLDVRGGARYYLTTKSLFNVFVEGGMTYEANFLRQETTTGTVRASSNLLRADLGIGSSVFINQNTSVDFGVKVNQQFNGDVDTYLSGFLRLKFWF